MSLYSQEKEQEVQVFSLYFEDCFSKKTAMEKSIFHSRVHIKQYLIIYNLYLVAVLPNYIVKAFVLAYTVFFAAIPFLNAFNSEKATPERVTMSTTKQKIMFFVYIGITVVGAYLFATNI